MKVPRHLYDWLEYLERELSHLSNAKDRIKKEINDVMFLIALQGRKDKK